MSGLIDEEKVKKTDEFFDRIHKLEMDYLTYWKENTLWHYDFWISLALVVIPWLIWFKVRKRGSEARLLLVGCFVIIVASWLDFLGIVFGAWHYSGKVLPTIPTYFPWDFALLPVTVLLWIQFKPHANPFLKAVIYAAITAFVGEPLFEWSGFYTAEKWSVFYSFPIYIVIYLLAYRISISKNFNTL